jgi:nitrogen-specific signal transduction histidine kinase
MSYKNLLHSVNNQLAVVMGKAELLGLKVDDGTTRQECREIQAAASKINKLMYQYVSNSPAAKQ